MPPTRTQVAFAHSRAANTPLYSHTALYVAWISCVRVRIMVPSSSAIGSKTLDSAIAVACAPPGT